MKKPLESCSNCKKLRRKIELLESAIEILDDELETYRHLKQFIECVFNKRESSKESSDGTC